MTSPRPHYYSSEEEPEERSPSRGAQSSSPSRSLSSGTKRRRMEIGESSRGGRETTPTPAAVTAPGPWIWYPELIRSWVHQEQVPSPYPAASVTTPRLPPLDYPWEQALAAVVAHTNRELRRAREACGALSEVIADQRKSELRIAALTNYTHRLDRSYDNLLDRNRELADEVLSLRAQISRANIPPAGMGNQELAQRLDILEHRHNNLAGVVDPLEDHVMDLDARFAELQIRVSDLEDDAPAEDLEADDDQQQGDDEGELSDAHSDISDAMEP